MTTANSGWWATATVLGSGITTFLLVAAIVIELLAIEFSALIGPPVGTLAGVACTLSLWHHRDRLPPALR